MAPDPRRQAPCPASAVRAATRSPADPRRVRLAIVKMTPAEYAACQARARARGVTLSGYLRRCALDEQWVAEALDSPLPPPYRATVAAHAISVRALAEQVTDPAAARKLDGGIHRTYWDGTE